MTENTPDTPAGPEGVDPEVFHRAYEGEAPWDTGRPQPWVLALIEQTAFRSPLLDLGCGTGENAIEIAKSGCTVVGVDFVPRRSRSPRKSRRRAGVEGVRFEVGDALDLDLSQRFATVVDAAVFHVFSDEDRPRYAASAARMLVEGGLLHVLVFTENLDGGGPRRVTQAEIRDTFVAPDWSVESIDAAQYETPGGLKDAWHARIRRS